MLKIPCHRSLKVTVEQAVSAAAPARLTHVIRYIAVASRRRHGAEDHDRLRRGPGAEEYPARGNGSWGVLKIAHPGGGFHLESDGGTPDRFLNDWWARQGSQSPWQ